MMMDSLIAAGLRLAEALRAENEALASLDLGRAASLADQTVTPPLRLRGAEGTKPAN